MDRYLYDFLEKILCGIVAAGIIILPFAEYGSIIR